MRQMKDSGITWIGKIPSHWNIYKIKEKYSFEAGFTPDTKNSLYYDDVDGYEWLSISDLNGKKYIPDTTKSKISRFYVKTFHPKPIEIGSLLYTFKLSVGQVAFTNREIFSNEAIAAFSPKQGYLPYLFYSSSLIEYNSNFNIYGARILNSTIINNSPLPYPPLDEQVKIVKFLDAECEKIDSIYTDVENQIETLEQYKCSVITEAVTKGLDKSKELKDTNIVWASKIPTHWSVMPNKYIMSKIKRICDIHKGEDIISLSMNGVIVRDLDAGGKMPTTFNGYQFVYPGNLLMCLFDYDVTPRCIGYINNYGITSPAYSQFVMKNNNCAKYYYYYYLMIDNTKELLHLAKNLRHSFTEDELGKIAQVVPPVEEQVEIADYLDKKCAEIDSVIADKKKQLEVLDNYKKSLIYEYVTGKKEVVNE